MILSTGTVFAGYVIERVLGTGSMGTVYVAWHPRLPRRDVLKVLPENHGAADKFGARFLREAELAARLDHPNIVAVHDRGIEHGRPWISMEFVDGIDVAGLLRRDGPMAPERVVHIVTEAARGLDEAHRSGILHRDVKPANILIEHREDGAERVLVADFGIASAAGDGTALTEVGTVVATLAYTAPESLADEHVDRRADVYALGCTLFEMLTGAPPFPRDSIGAVMRAQMSEPPPRATAPRPDLSPEIDAVIARALAKNPDNRYSSCGALAVATAAAFGIPVDETVSVARMREMPALPAIQPTVADRIAPKPQAQTPNRSRRRMWSAAAAAAALALVVAITGVAVSKRDSGEAPDRPPPDLDATGVTWGRYSFVIEALPQLLPTTPTRVGHQGIRCAAIEDGKREPDLTRMPEHIARIMCTGNGDPIHLVSIECTTNRTIVPLIAVSEPGIEVIKDERWERATGSGRMVWANSSDNPGSTGPTGTVALEFDEPTRNFCMVMVRGGSSGQDLFDRWWSDAPF